MKLIFDHSLSKKLAAALDDLDDQNQIVHLRVFFEDAKTPDPQWLRGLAERGEGTSIVVTADPHITRNPAEREAWLEGGATVVFLRSFAALPHWEQAAKLVKWWPAILKQLSKVAAGTGVVVSIQGEIDTFLPRRRTRARPDATT